MSMNSDPTAIRLNIGCGGRPLPGYVNIDSDDLETLKRRYPNRPFPDDIQIYDYDILNLPYRDNSVAEVRADSLIEHLSFLDEPKFFYEVKRILKHGGLFRFSTTDFEEIVKLWLAADDNWKEFYRNDEEAIRKKHWFGQYTYEPRSRWGYLCAMIFGSQNGEGQFHRNCYSIGKIKAILRHLDFEEEEISRFRWKGNRDPMINVLARKK